MDLATIPDSGLGWLDASGDHSDIVLSTRVRLARNLQGQAFGPRARVNDREAVLKQVKQATEKLDMLQGATLAELPTMNRRTRQILLERRLISRELAGAKDATPHRATAVVLASPAPISIMVNEEDHLRLQSLVSGLRFQSAWSIVDRLDEELGQDLPYAYHNEFGFLTSCPTNVGSGLRASVFMHLPGLRVYTLNKMMIFTQPAHLEQAAGRDLPPSESDAHRAAFVRRILDAEGRVTPESNGGDAPPDVGTEGLPKGR